MEQGEKQGRADSVTVESLNNLAKAIDKLTDAAALLVAEIERVLRLRNRQTRPEPAAAALADRPAHKGYPGQRAWLLHN